MARHGREWKALTMAGGWVLRLEAHPVADTSRPLTQLRRLIREAYGSHGDRRCAAAVEGLAGELGGQWAALAARAPDDLGARAALADRLARLVEVGRLRVERREVTVVRREIEIPFEPLVPPAPSREQTTFIALELVDPDGKPVPLQRYVLTLPDGDRREGRLDAEGRARIDGIAAGACEVVFPDLDDAAFRPPKNPWGKGRLPDLDFDVPAQKKTLLPQPAPPWQTPDAEKDEPVLLAANDDRLAVALTEEARTQHEKRGKDDTPHTADSVDSVPFGVVAEVKRPDIRHDHGFLDDGNGNLDESKRQEPTFGDRLERAKWSAKCDLAEALRPDLIDATRAYRHFLYGGGRDFPFSYEAYAAKDKAGARAVESAVDDTRAAAHELHDKRGKADDSFLIVSIPQGIGGDNDRYPYPGTENWQKAIGAHFVWLEASVTVTVDAAGKTRTFSVEMTLHAEDRYNFNPGAEDIATGTPDAANGRFEVTGLGHEYMRTATLQRLITFSAPLGVPADYHVRPKDQQVNAKKGRKAS